ncbi:MAG: SAM-dependent DNA methyltransferase, partial [Gemmatimonadetes bacterium]|nr:SAM-dependent DNA methyltransferase [Gemmatimonadota bacterium]
MGDTPALRKARGAFYTPPELSRFIAAWALRSSNDRVFEPSCGEAEFLVAAAERLRELGDSVPRADRLQGVEVHPGAAALAMQRLRAKGYSAEIEVADFFDVTPRPVFDAVIGNPPYVRYHHFTGASRRKGLEAALSQGVRLTGLASAWAPFVIHATRFLKPGGRIGMVLPGELLTVNYAAAVREFLLRRFARVRIVAFDGRVFPDVSEEVVLLLAEGAGSAPDLELVSVVDLDALSTLPEPAPARTAGTGAKWTHAFVQDLLEEYEEMAARGDFVPLGGWGEPYLGGVTGANEFFALTDDLRREWKIPEEEVLPIAPPGSKHLRTVEFTAADWTAERKSGSRVLLFRPDPQHPSDSALRYIAEGERRGVDSAYKCRVRKPWWRVPLVRVADLYLTYMNHLNPRLVTNGAGVHHLNSVHGVRLRPAVQALGRELLPLANLNTLSLLSAEIVGRAYGGGMLKLEPREAAQWLTPAPECVQSA